MNKELKHAFFLVSMANSLPTEFHNCLNWAMEKGPSKDVSFIDPDMDPYQRLWLQFQFLLNLSTKECV